MGTDMLRPSQAARRFNVSVQTLSRWAAAGLIGRSQVIEGGAVLYVGSDIADLIASKLTPRTVVPIKPDAEPEPDGSWEDDEFWSKASARRAGGKASGR